MTINVAYSTLINMSPATSPGSSFPGAEVIDPNYRPIVLTEPMLQVRQELFGSNPDFAFLNYRTHQLLQLLHSTELGDYIKALDPRITYLLRTDNQLYGNGFFNPQVAQTAGAQSPLSITGTPDAPDASGRSHCQYQITVESSSDVIVLTQTPPQSEAVLPYTLSGGLSQRLPLGATGYQFQIATQAIGTSWNVDLYLRPQWTLGTVAANLQARSGSFSLGLFGVNPPEPYLTFMNLWLEHPELPYSLGGLVLALIYRMNNE